MAVLLAAAAIPSLGLGAAGVVGGALIAGGIYAVAGYVDSRYVMPALFGKGKSNAVPPRLLGVPVNSNDPGAPRIWALGRRVRIPTHVLYQSEKVREQSTSNHFKGGTQVNQRQVFVDAAIALNDRKTRGLVQLVGNGMLLILQTRNLVNVTTHELSVTEANGILTILTASLDAPDFSDKFKNGDYVYLTGFVSTSGTNLNVGAYEVLAVFPHTPAKSSNMMIRRATGQPASTGVVANGGSQLSPATITRVDDQVIGDDAIIADPLPPGTGNLVELRFTRNPVEVFAVGDQVTVGGFRNVMGGAIAPPQPWVVVDVGREGPAGFFLLKIRRDGYVPDPIVSNDPWFFNDAGTETNQGRVAFWSPPVVGTGLFPAGFVPTDHYHDGSEDQGEDPILAAALGTGNVSAYRGIAYQVLDDFFVSQFGDSVPFNLEAVIDVDAGMTWKEALTLVAERGGMPREQVNVDDVRDEVFEGFFMRGAVSGVTNLIPLLLAGQITTQERNGVLCFQDLSRNDVVQVRNSAAVTDLGVGDDGRKRDEDDTLEFAHLAEEDLPSSVGIRHQDPDNGYADGYQPFGLRNPNARDDENRQEIDMSNLVLSRKKAQGLAATIIRRAYVNGTVVKLSLPISYSDVIENDVLTVTGDDGTDHQIRVIKRLKGANGVIKIDGVREELDLTVRGSPVEPAAGVPPPVFIVPPVLNVQVLDIPPLYDAHMQTKGLYVAASSSGVWGGATIYVSTDGETTWTQVESIGIQPVMGTLTATLPSATPSEVYGVGTPVYDATNTMTVEMDSDSPLLPFVVTTNEAGVEGGLNWFAIIDADGGVEIVGARDVTQTGALTFEFDVLLRGLRGTWQVAESVTHAVGARVVMVSSQWVADAVRFVPIQNAGGDVHVRCVPPGKDLMDVESVTVTPTWRSASPFDLRVITKSIGSAPNYDATFETERWTRSNQPISTLPPYPLDDIPEEFIYTIWDPTGATIMRTKTRTAEGTGSATLLSTAVVYTNAEQIADGYTPGASTVFKIAVQQVGVHGSSRLFQRTV